MSYSIQQPLSAKQQRKLKKLLRRPDIWRGESRRFARRHCLSSGYSQLDSVLVQQGWPLGGLIEIRQSELGMGEWQLIRPALQSLKTTAGYILLINPPAQPFAPGLKALGLNLQEILVVETKQSAESVTAFANALRHPACKAILFWEGNNRLRSPAMRKLQLACAGSQAFCLLFREAPAGHSRAAQHSLSTLKLSLSIKADCIQVSLLKQRGCFQKGKSQAGQLIQISLPENWKPLPSLSSSEWLEEESEKIPVRSGARILPFRANTKHQTNQSFNP